MRKMVKMLVFSAFLFGFSTLALAQNIINENWRNMPCVATQIDSEFFVSGENIAVFARSGNNNCSAPPIMIGDRFYNPLWLSLSKWNEKTWVRVNDMPAHVPVGLTARQKIIEYLSLDEGAYRLTIVNGQAPGPWFFLNAIYFFVGKIPNSTNFDKIPYFQPTKIVMNGAILFRGLLGGNGEKFAKGYIYQDKKEGTELLPVTFEQINLDEFFKGGVMDLPWIKVNLPHNSLDPTRPVLASITAPGGGMTVQGIIFDPLNPAAFFSGF